MQSFLKMPKEHKIFFIYSFRNSRGANISISSFAPKLSTNYNSSVPTLTQKMCALKHCHVTPPKIHKMQPSF